ncbi:MFS general substrate transporter [Delitschia confertaspora ATCC 74209]|uniref:MFS general substrate transporter n=1 Tax=Delitschia confertaspora ATCC 74209 TaxID=1513339 RepID=A0A9P4JPH6_9PLEO|nr:MFS general substrate transporter [Delitschia confertaspora ATCC 74209]
MQVKGPKSRRWLVKGVLDDGVPNSIFKPGWRFFAAFASLCIISLMAALDATSISVALPVMAKALGGSAIKAFWSGTSFLLASTIFQPILGSFSNIFGRKPLILTSLVFFGVGAIVAALAKDFTMILVGRTLMGVGGGGIMVLNLIVMTDMVPLRERGKWYSMLSSMWAIGTVTGPLLGGGFSENSSWRWIFWINLPFVGVGAVMVMVFLHLNFHASSVFGKLRRVDWLGIGLFLGSTTGFLIPITWGGVQYSWSSWHTLVPIIVSAVGMVAFVVHQECFATEPLIKTSVFKNPTAAITYAGTVIHGIVLWSILYYLPLYYEAAKGFSPILAGVAIFPQTFTIAPASVIAGAAIARSGKYRWAIWLGWTLTTTGTGLLVLLKTSTKTVEWIFITLVAGIGTGLLFPANSIASQASTATGRDQAFAATAFSFLRAFGQTLGVAIGGVIFQNEMKKNLLKYPLLAGNAVEYSKDAAGLVQLIRSLPHGERKHQLQVSYIEALKWIWVVMCVLSAATLFASLFIKAYTLDRMLETDQGFKETQKSSQSDDIELS